MIIYAVLVGCEYEGGFHGKQLFKLKTDALMEANAIVNKEKGFDNEYKQVSEIEWKNGTDYIRVVNYELI